MASFEYIQNWYKVPAEMHREIEFEGRKGIIVQDKGNYIGVQFYDDAKHVIHTMHPTYNVVYLDTFGNPPKVKNQKSKERYREYLNSETSMTFREWLGIK